jgi:hypothetical protein
MRTMMPQRCVTILGRGITILEVAMRKEYTPRLISRFWEKVERSDGCWNWTSWRNQSGYGLFTIGRSPCRAHRYSWELHFGPIPDGMCVLHRCDNRLCVRPDHLFLGTRRENAADMKAKGRQAQGERLRDRRVIRGEDCTWSKLSAAQVLAIRSRYESGSDTLATLSDEYGISYNHVYAIVRRTTWKHLP